MLSQAKEEKMAKLTDIQLIVLSKATATEDGAAVVPLIDDWCRQKPV
jgi:hypothetical protein